MSTPSTINTTSWLWAHGQQMHVTVRAVNPFWWTPFKVFWALPLGCQELWEGGDKFKGNHTPLVHSAILPGTSEHHHLGPCIINSCFSLFTLNRYLFILKEMNTYKQSASCEMPGWMKQSWKQDCWVHLVKAMVFPVVMYGCESWTIKKAKHQRIDAFELCCWRRLLRAPWIKEITPVNPKVNQSWIFIGRTDAGAPILWPPDAKSWLFGKDPDAGKDWKQEKAATKDEMVGWHHWLNGHGFEQTPGDSEG